jgi:uncharacterized membrane protein
MAALLLTGGIWLMAACMSALRSYITIAVAFAAGMGLALVSASLLADSLGATGMLLGLTAGLALIFLVLAARVFAEFAHPLDKPLAFLSALRRYRVLALVGLVYNAGIWVDKWIMWAAPGSEHLAPGLISHPAYESAMFLAYLTIVPAMALFVVEVETHFYEAYLRFYRDIDRHATLDEIRSNHREIMSILGRGVRSIALVQGVCCLLAILGAPVLIRLASGGLEMIPIFRFGVLGAFFHVLLILMLAVLAYFDLRRALLWVVSVFLVLNAGLTLASLRLSVEYQGYGYFLASLLTAAFALYLVVVNIVRLPFLTFVANNSALRAHD